jgi:hypothetical protein
MSNQRRNYFLVKKSLYKKTVFSFPKIGFVCYQLIYNKFRSSQNNIQNSLSQIHVYLYFINLFLMIARKSIPE